MGSKVGLQSKEALTKKAKLKSTGQKPKWSSLEIQCIILFIGDERKARGKRTPCQQ